MLECRSRAWVCYAERMLESPSPQDLLIRRGVLEDAALLAGFAAKTFADTFGVDNNPKDLQAHLERSYGVAQQSRELLDPDEVTLLAFWGETLVAYAQVRRKPAPECVTQANPVEVHRFYVDRVAHGQGVAQALMAEAKRVALELGGLHVWLGVWEHNPRAIAFYAKMGFEVVGSAEFVVGSDVQTDHIMVAPAG